MKKENIFYILLLLIICIHEGFCQIGSVNIEVEANKCMMIPGVAIWPVSQENGKYICWCAAATVVLQAAAGLQATTSHFNLLQEVSGLSCTGKIGAGLYDYNFPMQRQEAIDYMLVEVAKRDPLIYSKGITLSNYGQDYFDPKFRPSNVQNPPNSTLPAIMTFRQNILDGKPVVFIIITDTANYEGHAVVFYGYEKPLIGSNYKMWVMDGNYPPYYKRDLRYDELVNGKGEDLLQALYFKNKVFTPVVGIEDNIGISAGPTALSHPAGSPQYTGTFYDQPPYTVAWSWSWKIYFFHKDGAYVADSASMGPGNSKIWTANVGSLPTGYEWVRDSLGRVKGEVLLKVFDSDETSHWDMKEITYAAPPPPAAGPVLHSPANNSTDLNRQPTFTWASVTGSAGYRLEISRNEFCASAASYSTAGTSYAGVSLAPGTHYYWRVGTFNDWGIAWSSIRDFTTITPAPVLVSPGNNAADLSLSTLLDWQWTSDVRHYNLQVARNAYFTNMFKDTTLASSPAECFISGLAYATTYYWRVNAAYYDTISPWSETRSFSTRSTPPPPPASAPPLMYPENGGKVAANLVTFSWHSVQNATSYLLTVTIDSLGHTISNGGPATSYRFNPDFFTFQAGKTYSWNVCAVNESGSVCSSVRTFTVMSNSVPVSSSAGLLTGSLLSALFAIIALSRKGKGKKQRI